MKIYNTNHISNQQNPIPMIDYFTIGNHIYLRETSEGLYQDTLMGTRSEFSESELHIMGID